MHVQYQPNFSIRAWHRARYTWDALPSTLEADLGQPRRSSPAEGLSGPTKHRTIASIVCLTAFLVLPTTRALRCCTPLSLSGYCRATPKQQNSTTPRVVKQPATQRIHNLLDSGILAMALLQLWLRWCCRMKNVGLTPFSVFLK